MNVKVFVENYQIPFSRVTVQTGIGPLHAEIVIPPGENRRNILPGSRVNAFMQCKETDWKWVWWFRGYTTNFPAKAIGMDSSPIILSVDSEICVLESVLIKYLVIGQNSSVDVAVRENNLQGNVVMHSTSPSSLFFPFNDISDSSIGFGNRILGILQTLLALNPQTWERARQSRILDYLAIETNDNVSERLDKAVVFGAITNVLAQISTEAFTAMDVLSVILQFIFHDMASVAPMRYSLSGMFRTPLRDKYGYMPANTDWWNMPAVEAKSLSKAFCDTYTPSVKLFDHIIKPAYEESFPVIATNEIGGSDFHSVYVQDVGNTRTTMKFPFFVQVGKPMSMEEVSAPKQIEDSYELTLNLVQRMKDNTNVFMKSNLFAERITGIRTNEERVINKVIARVATTDPKMTTLLYQIGKNTPGTKEEKRKAQKEYLDKYANYEHEQSQGVSITIPDAVYNPTIMPGFYCIVQGSKFPLDDSYFGKIVRKIDVYDLGSQTCTSSYEITNCIRRHMYDMNAVKEDADFRTMEGTFEGKYGTASEHPVLIEYQTKSRRGTGLLDGNPTNIKEAISDSAKYFVPYQQSLTHIGLRDDGGNATILEPEDREPQDWPKSDPKHQYHDEILNVENFYTALDAIFIEADEAIKGVPKNIQIDASQIGQIREILNRASLTQKHAIMFLDSKLANYFSFASILFNNKIPPEDVIINSAIKELKDERLAFLPIWEGNPYPQRVDLLLHYLSMMEDSDWPAFINDGTVPRKLSKGYIPRPISDRQLIMLRKALAEAAYYEK